jgi:acyl carrier protein
LAYTEEQVFSKVKDVFIEALGVDDDEVTAGARIIDDLGAESLDFLDIVFRLERAFDVKIPRGDTERQIQDEMNGEPYEVDGVLTSVALVKLAEALPEVPKAEIQAGLQTKDIPRLFRVETFQNICLKLLASKGELAA